MLTFKEINELGDIVNTTWGRSSNDASDFPVGTTPAVAMNIKLMSLQGTSIQLPVGDVNSRYDIEKSSLYEEGIHMCVNYIDVVSFRTSIETVANMKIARETAEKRIAAKVKSIKDEFKSATGRSLKVKHIRTDDNMTPFTLHSPNISLIASPMIRPDLFRGYYNCTAIFRIE